MPYVISTGYANEGANSIEDTFEVRLSESSSSASSVPAEELLLRTAYSDADRRHFVDVTFARAGNFSIEVTLVQRGGALRTRDGVADIVT